jgi:hypothetical protein
MFMLWLAMRTTRGGMSFEGSKLERSDHAISSYQDADGYKDVDDQLVRRWAMQTGPDREQGSVSTDWGALM